MVVLPDMTSLALVSKAFSIVEYLETYNFPVSLCFVSYCWMRVCGVFLPLYYWLVIRVLWCPSEFRLFMC
jgi:hypothetical protein